MDIEERGVKLRLTVVDTPGFGDAINCEDSWRVCTAYIDEQFRQYFTDESGLNRRNIQDNRVHCCLYFVPPYGHRCCLTFRFTFVGIVKPESKVVFFIHTHTMMNTTNELFLGVMNSNKKLLYLRIKRLKEKRFEKHLSLLDFATF